MFFFFYFFVFLLAGLPAFTHHFINISPSLNILTIIPLLVSLLSLTSNLIVDLFEAKLETRNIKVKLLALLVRQDVAVQWAIARIAKQDEMIELQRETIEVYQTVHERQRETIELLKKRRGV